MLGTGGRFWTAMLDDQSGIIHEIDLSAPLDATDAAHA